jgi:hypothetical protein
MQTIGRTRTNKWHARECRGRVTDALVEACPTSRDG